MNITNLIILIIIQLILSIVTIVFSIFKESIFAYSKKRAENYATKKDLESMTRIVEDIKYEIQNKINEHEIKFSKLHVDRAEFLKDLYKKLYDLHKKLEFNCEMITCTDKKEKLQYYNDSLMMIHDIRKYYETNSILVIDEIDELIEKLFSMYEEVIKEIKGGSDITLTYYSGYKLSDKELTEGFDKINKGFEKIKNEIKEINSQIKMSFKKLLS